MQIFYNFLTFGATFSLSVPAGYGNAQKRLGIELVFLSNYDIIALPPAAGLSFPAGHHQDRGWQLRQPRRNSMKILALDIGGSFIKYAQFEDGVLAEPGAIPTQADQGPEALLRTVRHLADQFPEKQAVGISFASQINPVEGCKMCIRDRARSASSFTVQVLIRMPCPCSSSTVSRSRVR